MAFVVVGVVVVVVMFAVWAMLPNRKQDSTSLSGRSLRRLYRQQHGESPDFEGDYLREKREKRQSGGGG